MFSAARKPAWIEYVLACATFAVASVLNFSLKKWIGYEAVALVYLLSVVLLAFFVGFRPILFATTLTAFGWRFFFAPPSYSFHIASFYDKMMFLMYFVVAGTVAHLTAGLRAQRLAEQKREERSRALYLFTLELAAASDRADILDRAVTQVGQILNAEIALLLPDAAPAGKPAPFPKSTWPLDESQQEFAAQACAEAQPTRISSDSAQFYVPLALGDAHDGVLAVRLKSPSELTGDRVNLLDNLARQTALVLDRQRLRDAETNTRLLVESERFGRTLLNSVSHELRTPLAAISTAAATLRDSGRLSPIQQKLSAEIDIATARLNRLVQSLLSAAKIQSGQVKPNIDWCDITDVLRVALREVGGLLANHGVEKRFESGLPLIRGDFTLLQQAVVNLLVNAAAYTPKATQIEIKARRDGNQLIVQVADNGPGLPSDQIDHIFDLFHRAPGSKPSGAGLGLAIVKGFVEAQGGRVLARNRPQGGATFTIQLPVNETPQIAEEPT